MEISTFHGYYPHFVGISVFCGYYPHLSAFRRNIHVSGYYPHLVDTIVVDHIASYLAFNVCHVLHSFVLVVEIIFGLITSYLACNVLSIS